MCLKLQELLFQQIPTQEGNNEHQSKPGSTAECRLQRADTIANVARKIIVEDQHENYGVNIFQTSEALVMTSMPSAVANSE